MSLFCLGLEVKDEITNFRVLDWGLIGLCGTIDKEHLVLLSELGVKRTKSQYSIESLLSLSIQSN